MDIQIILDPAQKEPKITVTADAVTDEVQKIIELLKTRCPETINGYTSDGIIERIDFSEIIHIYTERQHVYCVTSIGRFILRKRLYEMEELLPDYFVRISNSEIVNIRKILRMDASLTGTIGVYLENDLKTFVSRRYIPRIREKLGI